jgi:signal transduction histidine kinase
VPATIVVAIDHAVRGVLWPQSVYGVLTASPWRSVEHAAWVIFEDIFLILSCRRGMAEMRNLADQRVRLEHSRELREREVERRTDELKVSEKRLQERESELSKSNRDLIAVYEVHRRLFACQSAAEVARTLTDALVSEFQAHFARVWFTRPGDLCSECALASECVSRIQCLHLVASSGFYTHIDGDHRRVPLGAFKIGLIAQGRGKTIANDVVNDDRVHDREWAAKLGLKSFAGFPLVRDGDVIGVMAMFSKHQLPAHLLKTFELLGQLGVSALTNVEKATALAHASRDLQAASRQAGMAEVATGVLHNVGNVLNSVNVSASLLGEKLHRSKVANLAKATQLMSGHADDLGTFLTSDEKGKQLPDYLAKLAEHLAGEQCEMMHELSSLTENVEHIKAIVSMQQSYAGMSGMVERVAVTTLLDEMLRMNADSAERHGITIERHYADIPTLTLDKHKLLQILANLVRNAADALRESETLDKRITVRTVMNGDGRIRIEVADNGQGISKEHLSRIFAHGFTTKKHGHGFGLHSSALAARELGGSLSVHSDGPARGAIFALELPIEVNQSVEHAS